MRVPGWAVAAVAILVVAASAWYVNAPPRSPASYRERAVETAEILRSNVQSTRIWTRTLERDKALTTAAAVGFREAEEDAAKAASSFAVYAPPVGSDALRSELSALGNEVEDALASVRIASQRSQWSRVPAAATPLPDLAARLERFMQRASG